MGEVELVLARIVGVDVKAQVAEGFGAVKLNMDRTPVGTVKGYARLRWSASKGEKLKFVGGYLQIKYYGKSADDICLEL